MNNDGNTSVHHAADGNSTEVFVVFVSYVLSLFFSPLLQVTRGSH